MRKTIARKMLKQFADHYDYDTGFMDHMLDVAAPALFRFNHLNDIASYHEVLPVEAHATTKLTGMLFEDCGPCSQLTVQMAEEGGMATDQLEAVIQRDTAAMSEEVRLAFVFAEALTEQRADLDEAREAIRAKWGDAGVIEATLGTQAGRLYPMVKRGMGYDKTCRQLMVAGKTLHQSDRAA